MTNLPEKIRIGQLICQIRSDINDLKPSDYISDKIAANASDSDIQEILMEYNINDNLFSLFTWGYLKKNSLDPIFIKNIFKRYLKEPNKLSYILGILPKRGDDNIKNLLNRSLHYYHQKYKKFGTIYFKDCGGIGFIIYIIMAIGESQVTKAIPLLKKMSVDLKMDEPNLSRAAQEAIENIKKTGAHSNGARKMKKCIECRNNNLIDKQISNSDNFEVICKDCGLVQMSKSDYLISKKREILKKKFYKIMRTEYVTELLSINKNGEKILKLITQIDDEHHGYLGVASQMFDVYLKENNLTRKFHSFLRKKSKENATLPEIEHQGGKNG